MRLLAFLPALLLLTPYADAKTCSKPIKIAVVDTGFGYLDKGHAAHLCKYGHKDFTIDGQLTKAYGTAVPVPKDINSHGTNIVGIIDYYMKKSDINYCIVILKFFSKKQTPEENIDSTVRAVNYATNLKIDYINYSGGGNTYQAKEKSVITKYLDQGGKLIAASGNDGINLDLSGNTYYPAMYDSRIIIVGNSTIHGVRSELSNYGSVVKRWEVGENIKAYGITLTGTSQATAVATGKIASESKCDIGN